jgi:hypothetical protein
VRPARATNTAELEVEGVLRFQGTSSAVPFALAHDVSAAGGMVTLSASSDVSRVRSAGADIALTAALGYGVSVRALRVSCDALALGPPASPQPGSDSTTPEGDGTYWVPRGHTLVFRSAPSAGSRADVHAEIPVLLSMTRLAHRAGWSRLAWGGVGGARIDGWVIDSALRPMPLGSLSSAPSGVGHAGCLDRRVGGTRLYRGPATVAIGTTVFAERGRGEWATVAREATVTVVRFADDPWVQVVEIEGLREECRQVSHAFVSADAVRLPEGANWP